MTVDVGDMLRPLSARSVVASTLLGTDPPAMAGRLLVAFGERFGISPGTTRVALSRMIERGELVNTDGVYQLAGPLLERKERQDRGRVDGSTTWDGTWEQAVVVATGRSPDRRATLRRSLAALDLGELREGVWLRPANLDPLRLESVRAAVAGQVQWFQLAPVSQERAAALVEDLFELEPWADQARALSVALEAARARLRSDDAALVDGFMLAAAALRHFVHDPRLPLVLEPTGWPAASLRAAYEGYQRDYQHLLRELFRRQR